MIGIIAKNTLTRELMMAALKDFRPIVYTSCEDKPDLLVIYQSDSFIEGFLKQPVPCPILVLGNYHEEADICLSVPCKLATLQETVAKLIDSVKNTPVFENAYFLFNGNMRTVQNKLTDEVIHLTEKENALVIYLATHTQASKEDLLTDVWNYNPDTQTHTVESHIYALKQKIGIDSQHFISNDESGYFLIR